ncbi:MAG: hypothetical protein IPP40_16955 [bacterium]|nr:hypothetical protein [bacterium]
MTTNAVAGQTRTYSVVGFNECGTGAVAAGNGGTRLAPGTGTATFALVTAGPPNWTYSMTVLTGCLNRVKIRDYCAGTTATAPTGWTVVVAALIQFVYSRRACRCWRNSDGLRLVAPDLRR